MSNSNIYPNLLIFNLHTIDDTDRPASLWSEAVRQLDELGNIGFAVAFYTLIETKEFTNQHELAICVALPKKLPSVMGDGVHEYIYLNEDFNYKIYWGSGELDATAVLTTLATDDEGYKVIINALTPVAFEEENPDEEGCMLEWMDRGIRLWKPNKVSWTWGWRWTKFQLLAITKAPDGNSVYSVRIDDKTLYNEDVRHLSDGFKPDFCLARRANTVFGFMFRSYVTRALKRNLINVAQNSGDCGFYDDGWHLPDPKIKVIPTRTIIAQMQRAVAKMLQHKPDAEKAKGWMLKAYELCALEHKDIMFAKIGIQFAEDCLVGMLGVRPWWGLYSPKSETGKTTMSAFTTSKIFGHVVDDKLRPTRVVPFGMSMPRFCQYVAGSTFPITFDEANNGGSKDNMQVQNMVKSGCTGNTGDYRMDSSGKKADFLPFLCCPELTFNAIPPFLQDIPMLRRGVIIPFHKVLNKANMHIWTEFVDEIPDGYLGAYLIQETHDWTLKTFQQLFKETSEWDNISKDVYGSYIQIDKLIQVGAKVMELVFGLRLDVSGIRHLLLDMKTYLPIEVLEFVKALCNGDVKQAPAVEVKSFSKGKKFAEEYALLNTQHINHLQNSMGRNSDYVKGLNLDNLCQYLQMFWPNVEGPVSTRSETGKTYRSINIPLEYIRPPLPQLPLSAPMIIAKINSLGEANPMFAVEDVAEVVGDGKADVPLILQLAMEQGYVTREDEKYHLVKPIGGLVAHAD